MRWRGCNNRSRSALILSIRHCKSFSEAPSVHHRCGRNETFHATAAHARRRAFLGVVLGAVLLVFLPRAGGRFQRGLADLLTHGRRSQDVGKEPANIRPSEGLQRLARDLVERPGLNGTPRSIGALRESSSAHVSKAAARRRQTRVSFTADNTVEIQGMSRAADRCCAASSAKYRTGRSAAFAKPWHPRDPRIVLYAWPGFRPHGCRPERHAFCLALTSTLGRRSRCQRCAGRANLEEDAVSWHRAVCRRETLDP